MPARTKITFQTELIAREILEDGDRALTLIRDEIIEDCNQYVPVQGSEKT